MYSTRVTFWYSLQQWRTWATISAHYLSQVWEVIYQGLTWERWKEDGFILSSFLKGRFCQPSYRLWQKFDILTRTSSCGIVVLEGKMEMIKLLMGWCFHLWILWSKIRLKAYGKVSRLRLLALVKRRPISRKLKLVKGKLCNHRWKPCLRMIAGKRWFLPTAISKMWLLQL